MEFAVKLTVLLFTYRVGCIQPAPAVFYSFDDLILMSEGEIFYHGIALTFIRFYIRFSKAKLLI